MRQLVGAVLALAFCVAPIVAEAQQAEKLYRIGLLLPTSAADFAPRIDTFRRALREAGYVEGQSIALEPRWAEGKVDRFPQLAAELVSLKVDVIVAWTTAAALAAKKATSTIPIVMATAGDPVGNGLVASLSRPGGNVTGNSFMMPEGTAKRMELLKQALPRVSRVAVLSNPTNPLHTPILTVLKSTADSLGARLVLVEARDVAGLGGALSSATNGGAGALLVLEDGLLLFPQRARIADLALKSRLPTMGSSPPEAEAGYLAAYGLRQSYVDQRAAVFVGRILRGARPAVLPVEQQDKFDLVINLKTAKALGLTIPPAVLARAVEVIE